MKKSFSKVFAIIYGIVLVVFSAYILCDAFLIKKNVKKISDMKDYSGGIYGEATDSSSRSKITETSYKSDNISIEITQEYLHDTWIYIADVKLSDVSMLRAGLAGGDEFARNDKAKTSEIAEKNGAIFAINGDYYGYRDDGYVMRNGYLYRTKARSENKAEDLVIYPTGELEIIDEKKVAAGELVDKGAVMIFSFGPGLVDDSEIIVGDNEEVTQSMTSNPRTAIGMVEPLHYIMVVSDGRTSESEGLSLHQLAEFMQSKKCSVAYNLDGGGSATMWFNGRVINKPTTNGDKIKERRVSDIVYIKE